MQFPIPGITSLVFLLIRSSSSQNCTPAPFQPVDVDLERSSGIWYEYLSGPNPGVENEPDYSNVIVNMHRIGFIDNTNLKSQAQFEEIQYRFIDSSPDSECFYTYFQGNRTACGFTRNNYWISGGPVSGISGFEDIYTVFSDPEFLEIYYRCEGEGPCTRQRQHSHVRTRKAPNELSVIERASIRAIVDLTLEPYCLGFSNLALQPYNTALPLCEFLNRPPEYVNLLNRVRAGSKTRCQIEKSYSEPNYV